MSRAFLVTALCFVVSGCSHQPIHQDPVQTAMNDTLHREPQSALKGAPTDGKPVCNSSNGGAVACLVNIGAAAIGEAASGK